MKALFGFSALATLILDVAAEPRVFGLDFAKRTVQNTPEISRLRRRAKTLSVDIDNAEIA